MRIELFHPEIKNPPDIPPSKSHVIRLIIAAAFADRKTEILSDGINEDIKAAISCMKSLGADISYDSKKISVAPIKEIKENARLYTGESASVLRFLLPLICLKGCKGEFITEGRLKDRPLSPLKEILINAGALITEEGSIIKAGGKINKTDFIIPGDVSSQFITGLMLMLSFTGGSIEIKNKTVSGSYIKMTAEVLKSFGCEMFFEDKKIYIKKCCPLVSPGTVTAEKDWSAAAVFAAAGAIGQKEITLSGMNINSVQGDRKILDILSLYGAEISQGKDGIKITPRERHAFCVDASDTPDLVPVMAVMGLAAEGRTVIKGTDRLRSKETDRVKSICIMAESLGSTVTPGEDCLIIEKSLPEGGTIKNIRDHRIIMAAALCSLISSEPVIIEDAEYVNKSYPGFFSQFI